MESEKPASSTAQRIALAVLVAALIGAGAYIYQSRGRGPERASAPVAAAPAVTMAPATGDAVLTAEQQQAMIERLRDAPSDQRKAWFHVQANNPTTGAVQASLQGVFERAGWTTETVRAAYSLKADVFLMAADETPPPVVETVNSAFSAAGLEVQYLTGYRAFFEDRKRTNPNWVGPILAADQPFVIVIGSSPKPRAP